MAWHTSSWVANRSIEYIKNHKHGPFILWISFPDPHTPFDCPEPWNRLHHPETVELPNQMNLDFEKGPGGTKKVLKELQKLKIKILGTIELIGLDSQHLLKIN